MKHQQYLMKDLEEIRPNQSFPLEAVWPSDLLQIAMVNTQDLMPPSAMSISRLSTAHLGLKPVETTADWMRRSALAVVQMSRRQNNSGHVVMVASKQAISAMAHVHQTISSVEKLAKETQAQTGTLGTPVDNNDERSVSSVRKGVLTTIWSAGKFAWKTAPIT